ncbi:MAG: FAD-dependent oxidoreductase [Candidatus Omnitrophica bacterium]|nr:FAD-dependent oxidoreductase [Candidatus Omnitrophota bacterium]
MKRIIILGSSAAGAKVIEEVRRNDRESEITIIALDGHYPYRRDAFASFISKEITPENVFYRSKDFYDQHNVNIILDQKISRVNFKRKRVFTEDKQQFEYDVLIVTDTPENRYPDIKGTNKENVYGYKKLNDIDKIVNALPVVKTVVIQSNSFSGFEAALSFIKREKEVILVSSEDSFLTASFETEMVEWLISKLEEKGLRVIRDNMISEILGDKDAKAVRLQSGKVFSAEVILFVETDEDLRLFSGSSIKVTQKIEVNAEFKAGSDDVFAVDQACQLSGFEPVTPLSVLEEQGETVAAVISGQERTFTMPLCTLSQNIEGFVLTVLGRIDGEGVTVNHAFDQDSGTYKGLYIQDNCLVGAVLVNKEDERDALLENIQKKVLFDCA